MEFLKELLSLYWVGGPFYIFTVILAVFITLICVVTFIHYLEDKEII